MSALPQRCRFQISHCEKFDIHLCGRQLQNRKGSHWGLEHCYPSNQEAVQLEIDAVRTPRPTDRLHKGRRAGCRPPVTPRRQRPVAQAFQLSGSRNFPVPRASLHSRTGDWKSPKPADQNVCATMLSVSATHSSAGFRACASGFVSLRSNSCVPRGTQEMIGMAFQGHCPWLISSVPAGLAVTGRRPVSRSLCT